MCGAGRAGAREDASRGAAGELEESGKPFHWIHACDGVHRWLELGRHLAANFFAVTDGMEQERSGRRSKRYAEYRTTPRSRSTRAASQRTLACADMVECHWEGSFEKDDEAPARKPIIAVKELVRALAAVAGRIEVEDFTGWTPSAEGSCDDAQHCRPAAAIVSTSRFADDSTKPELKLRAAKLTDVELQPIAGENSRRRWRSAARRQRRARRQALRMITSKARKTVLHRTAPVHDTASRLWKPKRSRPNGGRRPHPHDAPHRLKRRHRPLPGSPAPRPLALDRLSPEVRETVKHASILGVRFLSNVLGELLKRSGAVKRSLDELLLEAQREGVLIPAGEQAAPAAKS